MNLKAELEKITGCMTAAEGVFIMDTDGLVVEKVDSGAVPELEAAFIEFMQGLRSIEDSAAELKQGSLQELTLFFRDHRYVFRRISGNYFLILVMSPGGCVGEGSWRLRKAAAAMAGDFTL